MLGSLAVVAGVRLCSLGAKEGAAVLPPFGEAGFPQGYPSSASTHFGRSILNVAFTAKRGNTKRLSVAWEAKAPWVFSPALGPSPLACSPNDAWG